ncbi:MAG: DUF115 domain-containing protein, partial [Helicobacter sp.]|nr:DUF115 domain-containing protein [Helicobacter sp.]
MRQRKRRLCTALLCAVLIISNVLPAGMPVYAKSPDAGIDITNTVFSNETVSPMTENDAPDAPDASDGTDKQTGEETDNSTDSGNSNDNSMDSGNESDSNDSNDSVIGLLHQCLNMPQMLAAPSYHKFVKSAHNTRTAIIVSTGPSLYKQLPTLKKIAPYCTLYCIDASFPILAKAGIKPDIVLTLERVKESAKFYTDTPKEAQEGVIFAITSIAHEDTLNAITEGQKVLPMRPFPYTFYFDLPDYGYAGIGMSAANMAYEVIRHVGHENIVFIGQDLAFAPDGSSHAKGAVYGEKEISLDYNKKNRKDDVDIEAYGGNGMVRTTYIWRLFLKYLEIEIAKTPRTIKVFNCTEGGARIHGTEEIPFEEIYNAIDKSQAKQPI